MKHKIVKWKDQIVAKMAECRGMETEQLAERIEANWHRFLELK